jgi:transposase
MFIRRTITRKSAASAGSPGESYFTHRLVRSERVNGKVRQVTLLNLGRHFELAVSLWPAFCERLTALISPQSGLLSVPINSAVEAHAQRYAALLQPRAMAVAAAVDQPIESPFVEIDVDSLTLADPRSIAVEALALHAISALGIDTVLAQAGLSGVDEAAAIGLIVARMAAPGSERQTHTWLRQRSALGELLGFDFERLSLTRLYQAGDRLFGQQSALETTMYARASDLFGLSGTVALYDLTNTYFEGDSLQNAQAKRGFSKEKRSDCPLLTLALVLDGDGFVQRSQTFAGNVGEASTLKQMLQRLNAPANALVVMDRGIASTANLDWLRDHSYRYLVMERARQALPAGISSTLETAQKQQVSIARLIDPDDGDVRLLCHSEQRAQKEAAMVASKKAKLDAAIAQINQQLQKQWDNKQAKAQAQSTAGRRKTKPRSPADIEKQAADNLTKLQRRIGRLTERYAASAQHCSIEIVVTPNVATVVKCSYQPAANSKAALPGHYALRSNDHSLSAEQLWRTYITLTELESVFRSLKSELGLRPIHHQLDRRCQAHLFISVLAYQCVHLLRTKLKAAGIQDRWSTLRANLSEQRRVTARFATRNGDDLHIRKSTQPSAATRRITDALKLAPLPGKTTRKTFRRERDL